MDERREDPWLTIVGIGEDGWTGLGTASQAAIGAAAFVMGGARHLAHLPAMGAQQRLTWPSPLPAAFDTILARRGRATCILASGDPMLYGVGASLARLVDAAELRVLPHLSAFSLAAARLGWPLAEIATVSVHGRAAEAVLAEAHPGARLLLLAEDGETPARVGALLAGAGYGASRLVALEHLGGPSERRLEGTAADWPHGRIRDLHTLAVTCIAGPGALPLGRVPGLPDAAFRHDGQLTKRDMRAVTLGRLGPRPGELLWDVGAGAGSIAIEWLRAHIGTRAIAIEQHEARREAIAANARLLGVPRLRIVAGRAPAALDGLPPPDAIFIGGGLAGEGLVELCWARLKPGGRLVANAVTLEGEGILAAWAARTGGDLLRVALAHAEPVGRLTGWRPQMPVTQLTAWKPGDP